MLYVIVRRLISASSSPGKTTESAVYGYVKNPEIVEFRGQYFYGPNPVGASSQLQPIATSSHSSGGGWASGARLTNKSGKLNWFFAN